jgi:hypothetical protein
LPSFLISSALKHVGCGRRGGGSNPLGGWNCVHSTQLDTYKRLRPIFAHTHTLSLSLSHPSPIYVFEDGIRGKEKKRNEKRL